MINIKEEFLTHEKLVRAVNAGGYEVLGVWIAIKSHVGTNLTDGFIAKDDLVALKLPKALTTRKLRSCINALLSCGKRDRGGTTGPGLLVEVTGGYEMHDYLDHSNSCEQVELLREKARLKKARQREQARLELERAREERRRLEGTVPIVVPGGQVENVPGGHGEGTGDGTTAGTESGTSAGTSRAHAGDAQTQPNPTQEDPKAADSKLELPGKSDSEPKQRFGNLEQALELPIERRAQWLLENLHMLEWVQPHKWPEVQNLGGSIAKAAGWIAPRWTHHAGKAVLPMVRLLAEFSKEQLRDFVAAIPADEWVKEQGLSTMTDEVVRRSLRDRGPVRSGASEEAARAREERDRAAEEAAARRLGVAK